MTGLSSLAAGALGEDAFLPPSITTCGVHVNGVFDIQGARLLNIQDI